MLLINNFVEVFIGEISSLLISIIDVGNGFFLMNFVVFKLRR